MSRVDKPTLKCDRCEIETQDLREMGRFAKLEHLHMSGTEEWDLCPPCWDEFRTFMTEGAK
jgi:hypothetical protein